MAVETFDHTGDVGIRVAAPTLDRVFAEAAFGLTDVITDASRVEPRQTVSVAMAAPDLDLLLHDFLSDLLFRFETAEWLTRRAAVVLETSQTPMALEATLYGEPLDTARHGVKVLVKAVTYHELTVKQDGHRWLATIVFDI